MVVLVPSGTTGIVSAAGAVIAPLTSTSGIEPVPSAGPVCPLASIWYPSQTKASSVCPVGLRYHVKSRSALFTVQAWAKPVRLAKSLWNSFTNSPKTQLPENLPKQILFKLKTTKLLQLSANFFCCERLSASMARSLHLSFICIPQSTRATTSAVSKTLPGFQNSKQNSKSTNKVKSTSAILYFWINSVHGNKKHLKPKYLVVHSSKWVFTHWLLKKKVPTFPLPGTREANESGLVWCLAFWPPFWEPKPPILWRYFGTWLETTNAEAPKSEPGKVAACRHVSRWRQLNHWAKAPSKTTWRQPVMTEHVKNPQTKGPHA